MLLLIRVCLHNALLNWLPRLQGLDASWLRLWHVCMSPLTAGACTAEPDAVSSNTCLRLKCSFELSSRECHLQLSRLKGCHLTSKSSGVELGALRTSGNFTTLLGICRQQFTMGDPENVQALQLGWARCNLIQAAISSQHCTYNQSRTRLLSIKL